LRQVPTLKGAVNASIKAGITYMVSAGKYGDDASRALLASNPDAIIGTSITDSDGKCGWIGTSLKSENSTDQTFAYFSNFGHQLLLLLL
jgi:hypothetical protein